MTFHLNKVKKFIPLFIIMATIVSCHNYYKASQVKLSFPSKTVDSLQRQNRYFILRDGDKAYYMNDILLSEDRKTLSCSLDSLPTSHQLYLTHGRRGHLQYLKSNPIDLGVLTEVHFYIDPAESTAFGKYTLQLDKIEKIEVIEKDKKRTTSSYVAGALGYTVGALAIVGIIVHQKALVLL